MLALMPHMMIATLQDKGYIARDDNGRWRVFLPPPLGVIAPKKDISSSSPTDKLKS